MNENMLCSKTHEYVLEIGDKYEVGITDYAIQQLNILLKGNKLILLCHKSLEII